MVAAALVPALHVLAALEVSVPALHVLAAPVVLVAAVPGLVTARVPVAVAISMVGVMVAADVTAEAAHTDGATVGHRLPRALRRLPSSRAARSRSRSNLWSKTWRNCSMSRSMRSFAT
jgi:hypothetical protein